MGTSDRKPTINDVARAAGVSKKTVSRVINRSPLLKSNTREKVETIIRELGYVPNPQARALALRRNFLIGILHDNPNAQMLLNFQEGVLDAIRETEFSLVVRPVDRQSPNILSDVQSFLERQRPHGVLILPPISEDDSLADLCRDFGCGYVRMGSARLDDNAHLVESNDGEVVEQAVNYLISLGHTRIGLVTGPRGFRSAFERREGFLRSMKKNNLDCPAELISLGDYTFSSGLSAAEKLLNLKDRPTAIFSSNDEMAAGALHAACQSGLVVPDDLSLIGFDDTSIAAHIWPPLTTVRWPIIAMARAAALKLVHPESANDQPSRFLSEIVKRSSVAAPRL